MSKSTLVDFYKVKQNSSEIKLEVEIGFAQQAATSVRLDGKKLNGEKENSFELILGKDINLTKKELFLTTIILDVSKETNNTSLKITLTGGTKKYSAMMKQTVLEEGGIATYVVHIEFFN